MKRCLATLLAVFLLAGCSTKDNLTAEEKIEKLFSSPYITECTATVTSNKTVNEYRYTCQRYDDGSYTMDYGDMSLTVNNQVAVLEKDGIKVNVNSADGSMALIPTYFFDGYTSGGTLTETEDGYLLEYGIDNNLYKTHAQMCLDKNLIPQSIQIYNLDKEVIKIEITKYTTDERDKDI